MKYLQIKIKLKENIKLIICHDLLIFHQVWPVLKKYKHFLNQTANLNQEKLIIRLFLNFMLNCKIRMWRRMYWNKF